ncbi:Histone deacetylase complex subunit SAP18, partial [Eschrichtius robustus]|nr:Histone deacetylase complex subunit SAP18 [Eschrichtius robustus]
MTQGRHHRLHEFSRGNVPSSELQIYIWMDATLKELTRLAWLLSKGDWQHRVWEKGTDDDSMTLQSQKFQIGDCLDIAITPPNRAPPPSGRMRPY